MAKQRNTHEKRLREQSKKRKSEDKRAKRVARKDAPSPGTPVLPQEEMPPESPE
jgi:hypothetical protein